MIKNTLLLLFLCVAGSLGPNEATYAWQVGSHDVVSFSFQQPAAAPPWVLPWPFLLRDFVHGLLLARPCVCVGPVLPIALYLTSHVPGSVVACMYVSRFAAGSLTRTSPDNS